MDLSKCLAKPSTPERSSTAQCTQESSAWFGEVNFLSKMDKEVAVLQRKLEAELKNFKDSQKEFNKLVQTQQQLDGQFFENKSIMEELQMLKPTNTVYKLYGPVLVKQDLDESKQNVGKRIEYISKELKRCAENINQLEQKQDKYRANLQKLQQQYQSQMALAKQ
uniref:Probable prefoldin subunit 6 n=2 Tax=Anopheles atroparvus TaxID=41427 RepID=A0A182JGB5_ANOAO